MIKSLRVGSQNANSVHLPQVMNVRGIDHPILYYLSKRVARFDI